jgi:hypothetical protein
VPPTNEALQGFQLGPLRIFEGGFGGEDLLQGQPFELADLILIERADPQVADALAFGRFARPPQIEASNLQRTPRECLIKYLSSAAVEDKLVSSR